MKDKIKEVTLTEYIHLVKWLYDNHPEVLREYEKKNRFKIDFLGDKK